ncbi:hypothetical protein Agub_g403 [Astrephomene gubernaculifera]|uniref:Serine aminopeptidase S33 domain-containing protein n=1 Tax=Astrephomene gubernaculifera TaxID=47775 RepID=A0AAD3DDZ6_9CHLO|nr:hypothetical protein Agub_g403 [Astrephomene gubernaculifera]
MLGANVVTGIHGIFVNSRRQKLHTLHYPSKSGPPAALLFLHHGLAEHSGRYDKGKRSFKSMPKRTSKMMLLTFAWIRYPAPPQHVTLTTPSPSPHSGSAVCRYLADNGIAVYTYDAHGHGRSEPLDVNSRAYIQSYTHLVDDLSDYMDSVLASLTPATTTSTPPPPSAAAAAPDPHSTTQPQQQQQSSAMQPSPQPLSSTPPPPPVFMLGHSMGGLVAALLCLRRQQQVAGLLLHSPLVDIEWTPVLRVQAMVGGLLATLVPRARLVPAVRPEDMSQDPRVVADYVADPLNTVGPVRTRTGHELLRGVSELRRRASELVLPVYVCHGTRDATTSAAMSRRLVEGPGGVSSGDKVFRSVEGGYHELLHGPEWEECTGEVLAWMRARMEGRAGSRAVGGGGAGAGAIRAKM